ncbi:uncharacterized protein BJ212DRAFT_1301771 [Suillus subaureus]|uniref:Uncharacterized protein n=1 Tax=Suillus subaureus TaxID=48587 RepID=A0A9P7JAS2_9AGAM|nr:uncharacterized protein BJ212DRAFT_1301771 [Suillus subaureus]KAG1811727.1 hypothetical protein BJ212DRAFT_1301771 [Suillus subaureus]
MSVPVQEVSGEESLIVSCGPAIRVMYHFKEMKVLVRNNKIDFVLVFRDLGTLPSTIFSIIHSLPEIRVFKDLIVINNDLINPNPDNIEDANEQNVNANAVPSQRQQKVTKKGKCKKKYENDSIPADNDNIPEPDLIITGYQRALSIPANNNNASEPNLIINDSQRELSIPSLLSLNNVTQGLPNNGDYVIGQITIYTELFTEMITIGSHLTDTS